MCNQGFKIVPSNYLINISLTFQTRRLKQEIHQLKKHMKCTIEINDTLQDRADSAIEDVKQELLNYLKENPDTDSLPDMGNDLDYSGAIQEIVDGSVPIYTSEINDAWYLHRNELEEAYENAGVGDNPLENNGMAAIYYFIHDAVNEWYANEAEEVFSEWQQLPGGRCNPV